MATNNANLALQGGDPRNPKHIFTGSCEPIETQLLRAAHDSSVPFEEYVYWASVTRAEEKAANDRYRATRGPRTFMSTLKNRFSKGEIEAPPRETHSQTELVDSEKEQRRNGDREDKIEPFPGQKPDTEKMTVTPGEWKSASRAVRTASWSSIFYLVTTDILGPFSVPYVHSFCN